MRRLIAAFVLLLALPVLADVVIRTRDGSVFRLPINPQDIVSIEMAPSGVQSPAPPPQMAPAAPAPAPAQVSGLGAPWVVNSNGNIFRGDGRSWQDMPGLAKDIGVSVNGAVWVIGTNPLPGGFGIYRLLRGNWEPVDGAAVRVAVDSSGAPWVVNSEGRIYRRTSNGWQEMPGRAVDIGAGGNGQVWVIGTDSTPGGFGIYRWSGSDWNRVDGGAVRIAVGPSGNPWVVNSEGRIFSRETGSWTELPGRARDIAVSAGGTAWVIGTDNVPGGQSIHYWSGSSWVRIEGGAVGIAAR
ncbi:MAG: hypothetical protein LW768_21150 [Rubrivivax sp.]|jgi:hypothetical protein|nr:hypothetical protein [Rubrivivax sp.]